MILMINFKLFSFIFFFLILIPGSNNPKGPNNVVQWEHKNGETITYKMGYENGRLLVEKDGYYYLYSKVTLDAAEECLLIQHMVMKDTTAYDESIELMKSKRLVSVPLLLSFVEAHVLTSAYMALTNL